MVAEALQGTASLAEARAITSFRANERLSLPLELFACAGASAVCDPSCVGFGCKACGATGVCDTVMVSEPDDFEDAPATPDDPVDAGEDAGEVGGQSNNPVLSAPDAASISMQDAGPLALGVECDDTHPCSPGYRCSAAKCVSLCTDFACDPNAICSLVNNAPACICKANYVTVGLTCVRDVTCEELQCHANAACVVNRSTQIRECACHPGYMGTGKACSAVSCPTITIANGTVSAPNGTSYPNTVTYRCNPGYSLPRGLESHSTCLADGSWSFADTRCLPVECGMPPPAPAHGTTSYTQTTYNGRATYRCDPGYALQGLEELTCQMQGTWSGSAPTCVPL